MKKFIAMLTVSVIILGGCGTSAVTKSNETASKNSSGTISKSASTENGTTSAATGKSNTASNTKISVNSSPNKALSSTAKTNVNNEIKPVVTSIDNALNSLDDIKDINVD